MILEIWEREYLELYSELRRARAHGTQESAEVGCLLSIAQSQSDTPTPWNRPSTGQTTLAAHSRDDSPDGDQIPHGTPESDSPEERVDWNINVNTPGAFDFDSMVLRQGWDVSDFLHS